MDSSLRCGNCSQCLFDKAEIDVMFYCKGKEQVHIAVKPEREVLVRKRSVLKFVRLDDGAVGLDPDLKKVKKAKRTFAKTEDLHCNVCGAGIGVAGPYGPESKSVVTFGRDKISLCGVPPTKKTQSKKAPKFYESFKTQIEWSGIERRSDDDFFCMVGGIALASEASGRGMSFKLFVPDFSLQHPKCHQSWLTHNLSMDSNKTLRHEMQRYFGWFSIEGSSGSEEDSVQKKPAVFSYITHTSPRNYQILAYIETLIQNMIVVMPTGTGKTLVAALVMKKLKTLNPQHTALFIVDRVPLVFQQGGYLERETGLRVCKLCGENKKLKILRDLNQCHYDVLVVTAGCLLNMMERGHLDWRVFCTIVFDECHHATGDHVYVKLLREMGNAGLLSLSGPRILGLSASPVTAKNPLVGSSKLRDICAKFGNAGILHPNVPKNPTTVEWEVVRRSEQQRIFAIWALREVNNFLQALSSMIHDSSSGEFECNDDPTGNECDKHELLFCFDLPDMIDGATEDELDQILNPSAIGRLRGQLREIGDYYLEADKNLPLLLRTKTYVSVCLLLVAALESSETMGVKFAHAIVNEFKVKLRSESSDHDKDDFELEIVEDKIISTFANSWNEHLASFSGINAELSPRLKVLHRRLLHFAGASSSGNNPNKKTCSPGFDDTTRALVLVNTREAARQLTSFLKGDATLGTALKPLMVVGHGGFDGMSWQGEQEVAIAEFRSGSSRLLIATSVLEEGLDVPACNLVALLQGVSSLISFIQSRGRARCTNSKMLVIASREERSRLDSIRMQEVEMKALVQKTGKAYNLPSDHAMRICNVLSDLCGDLGVRKTSLSDEASSVSDLTGSDALLVGSDVELVVQIWVVADALRRKGMNCKKYAETRSDLGEDTDHITSHFESNFTQEDLEEELNKLLVHYNLEEKLYLSQASELDAFDCKRMIFDQGACRGFMVSFGTPKHHDAQINQQGNELRDVLDSFCDQWGFSLFNDENLKCWVHQSDVTKRLDQSLEQHGFHLSPKDGSVRLDSMLVSRCSAGRWGAPNIFVERYKIPSHEISSICFKSEEGIDILFHDLFSLQLHVSQSIIAGYTLVDVDRENAELRLYIPLESAPIFTTTTNGDNFDRVTDRNQDTYPQVQPFSTNNVLCLGFHEPSIVRHVLKSLECDHIAAQMFDTRVHMVDQIEAVKEYKTSTGLFPSEQAFLKHTTEPPRNKVFHNSFIDLHHNPLPVFCSEEVGFLRDVNWVLLCLFSKRLGCFTDEVRSFLTNEVASTIQDIWGPVSIAKSNLASNRKITEIPEEISWILFALLDICDDNIPYWGNVIHRFQSIIDTMKIDNACGGKSLSSSEIHNMGARRTKTPYASSSAARKTLFARDNKNWFKLYRAMKTPTRVIYLPQIPVKGSRLFRSFGSERFVSVLFCDEQKQRLHGEEVLEIMKRSIEHPVVFSGRETLFFGASSSQLREQHLLYVDVSSLPQSKIASNNGVQDRLRQLRESIISKGSLTTCPSPPKYLSWLALYCTADTPTIVLNESDVITIPDIFTKSPSSTQLTDGNGFICHSSAREISEKYLKLKYVPSAVQIRWRGAKGVLTVVSDDFGGLKGHKIALRDSMVKCCQSIAFPNSVLCVLNYSKFLPMFLNREIINLLTSVPNEAEYCASEVLYQRMDDCLKSEGQMFSDRTLACKKLKEELAIVSSVYGNDFIPRHFSLNDPLWVDILRTRYRHLVRDLVEKTRIPIDRGCQLIGIVDPVGVLDDGEVFVQIKHSKSFVLDKRNVMIFRNPCLHPGDMRIVSAVDYPELHDWCNVVVFPCNSQVTRNLPLECSGGDLDGDCFYVCWDEEIVMSKEYEHEPFPYHDVDITSNGSDDDLIWDGNSCTNDNFSGFIGKVFSNNWLGKIARTHLIISDIKENGARDKLAIEVAKEHPYAVDYPKTGMLPNIPESAIKLVRNSGCPDFMDSQNRGTKSYISRKPLGDLYRRAASFEFNYPAVVHNCSSENEGTDINAIFLLPGRENHSESAMSHYTRYLGALRCLMVTYGIESDSEALLGRALHWHPLINDYGKAQEVIKNQMQCLLSDSKEGFREVCKRLHLDNLSDKAVVASAWYEVAYKDGRAKSFCLAVMDVLNEFFLGNQRDMMLTGACSEKVGSIILNHCKDHAKSVGVWSRAKLSICELIKDWLVGSFNGLKLNSESIKIHPFGSVGQGLCEQNSDLDICVNIDDSVSLCGISQTERKQLSLQDIERQILQVLIMPRLSGFVDEVQEFVKPKVPFLRCSIPSPVDIDMDSVTIDVSCNFSGLSKCQWLQLLFYFEPSLYPTFLLLQQWAREANIIRSNHTDSLSNSQELKMLEQPMLTTGQFHALILLALKKELVEATAKCAMHVNSLGDVGCIQATELCQLAVPGKVGNFILCFFGNVQHLLYENESDALSYAWPMLHQNLVHQLDTPAAQRESLLTTIPMTAVGKISSLCEPSLHSLVATRSVSSFLEFAAGNSKLIRLIQKLPLSLSHRIGEAYNFHSKRLELLSNCRVKIEKNGQNAQLILSAQGTRKNIATLKNEILNSNRKSSWQTRPASLGSRYHMEGASDIRVNGSQSLDLQLCFRDLHNRSLLVSSLHQLSVCRLVNSSKSEHSNRLSAQLLTPTDLAIAQSIERLMLCQLSQMPEAFFKQGHDVRLRVGFGSFVVINISQSLPESRLSLSLKDLLAGIEKCGKSRRNWLRRDPSNHYPRSNDGNKSKPQMSKLGKSNNSRKKKEVANKSRPGIHTTFVTCFDGEADDICHKLGIALQSKGYSCTEEKEFDQPINSNSGKVTYKVSLQASPGYEVIADFEDASPLQATNRKCAPVRVYERPLNLVHYTLLGNGQLPDMRVRLETTNTISTELSNIAFSGFCKSASASPIYWKNSSPSNTRPRNFVPAFVDSIEDGYHKKLLHIRQYLKQIKYEKSELQGAFAPFSVKISRTREFKHFDGKIRFDMPQEKAEMFLDFNVSMQHLEGAAALKKLAIQILKEGLEICRSVRDAGIDTI